MLNILTVFFVFIVINGCKRFDIVNIITAVVVISFDGPMSRKFRLPAHQDIFSLTGTLGYSRMLVCTALELHVLVGGQDSWNKLLV